MFTFFIARQTRKEKSQNRSQRRVNSEMAQSKCTGNVTPFAMMGSEREALSEWKEGKMIWL
jgi:hypothetical protein